MNDTLNVGRCRYNREMYDIVNEFARTGRINYKLKMVDKNLKINIVYTIKQKHIIINHFCKKLRIGDRAILLVNNRLY